MMEIIQNSGITILVVGIVIILGLLAMIAKWYKKPDQGTALVRTGVGGIKVSKKGMLVIPVLHKLEVMNISLNTIVINRNGSEGLICKDNLRADIQVAFFVKVNPAENSIIEVAQSVGCERASSKEALEILFDAKFSEALKTVGKRFNFVDLYNKRDEFRHEIIKVIGTDLTGYILDDAAIDYLEQTRISALDVDNILDAEGIKKITELTAQQKVLANQIKRDEEKTITQQDVEAREAILEMEKQLAETEEKQKREVANIKAREEAEISKVSEEERQKAEIARIATEEQILVAEENKQRQVIISAKSKERTEAIETERVIKDKDLEATEREKIVTLAQIEKEKSVEKEKKNIQEVIRERVAIEKTVVQEEEKIKDTKAFSEAERVKQVAIVDAEKLAEASLVQKIKDAEAEREAAEFLAKEALIKAQANQESSVMEAEAIKTLADAEAAQKAAVGIAEAQVMEAKAAAREKEGDAEAAVIEANAVAESKGITAKANAQSDADIKLGSAAADVTRKQGLAEAEVIEAKATAKEKDGMAQVNVDSEAYTVEAKGIEQKAEAMKKLDGVGKEHEEFKLELEKETTIELAQINIQKDIADAQATVLGEALKAANIDIVGGEQVFFDKITNAITNSKSFEKYPENSNTLQLLKNQLLDDTDGTSIIDKFKTVVTESGIKSNDIKNLSVSALISKMMSTTQDGTKLGFLESLLGMAKNLGIDNEQANKFLN